MGADNVPVAIYEKAKRKKENKRKARTQDLPVTLTSLRGTVAISAFNISLMLKELRRKNVQWRRKLVSKIFWSRRQPLSARTQLCAGRLKLTSARASLAHWESEG